LSSSGFLGTGGIYSSSASLFSANSLSVAGLVLTGFSTFVLTMVSDLVVGSVLVVVAFLPLPPFFFCFSRSFLSLSRSFSFSFLSLSCASFFSFLSWACVFAFSSFTSFFSSLSFSFFFSASFLFSFFNFFAAFLVGFLLL